MKGLLTLLVCLLPLAFQAQVLIQGQVTDGLEPLTGVSIYDKEAPQTGAITDLNGAFTLTLPDANRTLVFSYIGYQTMEIPLLGRTTLEVILEESAQILDEVVVSALGVEKDRKALGYSTQEVSGDDLVSSRETNLVSSLSGKIAGVDVINSSGSPGASANIVIRGRTSFSGPNGPLFVVDGIPVDNSYAGSNFTDQSNRAIDLNPADIASITVLKGTAATALYGIRAGNGAVIIATHKGRADGQTHIRFSTSFTADVVNKLPEKQDMFAQGLSGQYIDPQSGSPSSWGPLLDTLRYAIDPTYTHSLAGRIVGQSDPLATNQQVEPFDNLASFFQPGWTSSSYLQVDGGNQIANYLVAGGYHYQTGIIPTTDFQRINIRLSGEVKPFQKLTLAGSATYTQSGGNRGQRGSNLSGVMLGLLRTPPSFDLTNGFDNPVDEPLAYSFEDGTQRTYNPSYDNPYWSIQKNRVTDRVNRIIGQAQATYDFSPSLRAIYRLGMDVYGEERKSYWDGQSGEFKSINGLIIDDLYNFSSLTSDFLLTFDRRLSDDLSFRLTGGHSYYQVRAYNAVQEGENFIIPGFYDISNVQTLIIDDFLSREKLVGLFYEAEIGWKDFLYLTTTGRNDWSSTLPAGNNSFFYPSVSLSAVLSEPLGWSTSPVLNYAKVRFSYGSVGNDAPGAYLLGQYFESVAPVQGQISFLQSAVIGNANLQPERTESFEAGIELNFLKSRLNLDLAAYYNQSEGQILEAPVAFSSGFSSLVTNVGLVENKGIEAIITAKPLKTRSLDWTIQFNFSANRNNVLEVSEGVAFVNLPGFGLTSTRNVILAGQPYGVLFGARWLRNENGDILIDDSGYPVIDPVLGVVGNPNPNWIEGIRNTFAWKSWTLGFQVDIRQGGDIFNGTRGVMRNLGIHADTESREEEIVFEGVRQSDGQPNTIAIRLDQDFYSRYPFAGVSEAVVEDGSFVRLREFNLGYRFKKTWTLTLTGRNLWLWTKYTGIDPETNLSGASNSFGRDYFNSPNTRSLGIGVQADF